jgi:hypothetical protein
MNLKPDNRVHSFLILRQKVTSIISNSNLTLSVNGVETVRGISNGVKILTSFSIHQCAS